MTSFALLLILTGCSLATPPSPPPAIPDAPAEPGVSGMELSPAFPEIHLRTRTTFAHDRGNMTRVEQVMVGGKEVTGPETLAALVRHRGGYTPDGGRSDAEVIATVDAFFAAWDRQTDIDRQVGPEPSRFLANTIATNPQAPAYHPPKVTLETTLDGERVVVVRQWAYSFTGRRGNVFNYIVRAFRVSDGMPVALPNQPVATSFTEGAIAPHVRSRDVGLPGD